MHPYTHRLLERIQPQRRPDDVFRNVYALNTAPDVRKAFFGLVDHSYIYTALPSYYFGSWAVHGVAWASPRASATPHRLPIRIHAEALLTAVRVSSWECHGRPKPNEAGSSDV